MDLNIGRGPTFNYRSSISLTDMKQRVISGLADDAIHHLHEYHGYEVGRLRRLLHLLTFYVRPLLTQGIRYVADRFIIPLLPYTLNCSL